MPASTRSTVARSGPPGEGHFEDGTLVAEASGLFIQVPLEHFAEHGSRRDVSQLSAELGAGLELNP